MATALKNIETKVMQLGLKLKFKLKTNVRPRNDTDWNFKIAGEEISWRASVKYLGVIIDKKLNIRKQIDYIRQKTDRKMNLLTIGRQHKYFEEFIHINYTINTGVRSSYFRHDGVPRGTSAKIMRHELQMLPWNTEQS